MAVGLVVVSHSARLAEGVVELAGQMTHGEVRLIAAGGTDEGGLGTSLAKVSDAIAAADGADGVLVLFDLGSAALVTDMALEVLSEAQRQRIILSDAPLVEGAVTAAVEAWVGSPLAAVAEAARSAATMRKLPKKA